MKKMFVCPNKGTRQHMDTAAHCIELLQERLHVTCSLFLDTCMAIYGDARYVCFSPEDADAIVAIGGDGAVLRAAQTAIRYDKPLLGINTGRLGHLCCLQPQDLMPEAFERLHISGRTLLCCQVEGQVYTALNDIVVAKEHFGETLELQCFAGELQLGTWRGDGLITATPTGSTAYNSSAGGPILEPDVPALVLTAICAHGGGIAPRIVSDTNDIRVHILRATNGDACVYADGVLCGKVSDTLRICRSQKQLSLFCK